MGILAIVIFIGYFILLLTALSIRKFTFKERVILFVTTFPVILLSFSVILDRFVK